MGKRHDQDFATYDKLFYPGNEPRVPINKLDIRTHAGLEKAEAEYAAFRTKMGIPPAARELTYDGLKALHHHLFQDVYSWAGEQRTYTTGRTHSFGPPEHIEGQMNKLFKALARENHLRGLEPSVFAERAAKYVNDVNAYHPFIEGNGRAQRLWLTQLAGQAGYDIDFERITKDQWYEASKIGFLSSDKPMAELIAANLTRLEIREIDVAAQQAPIMPA